MRDADLTTDTANLLIDCKKMGYQGQQLTHRLACVKSYTQRRTGTKLRVTHSTDRIRGFPIDSRSVSESILVSWIFQGMAGRAGYSETETRDGFAVYREGSPTSRDQ